MLPLFWILLTFPTRADLPGVFGVVVVVEPWPLNCFPASEWSSVASLSVRVSALKRKRFYKSTLSACSFPALHKRVCRGIS